MKPVKNARRIAMRSYSLWLNRLAVAGFLGSELLYRATGIDTNPYMLGWVYLGLYVAVEIARYVDQGLSDG